MKALQYVAAGKPEIKDIDRPKPATGEVLLRVLGVTTCPHWDLHLMAGEPMFPGHKLRYPYSPGQPGHEAMGEVAAVGKDAGDFKPGQRVVAWRDPGHEKPGCYAQYVKLAADDLLAIPDTLTPEQAASLELAMCVQVSIDQLQKLRLLHGRRVAVSGLGPAGLVAIQLARISGAKEVVGIDPLAERRNLACALGATSAEPPGAKALPPDRHSPKAFDAGIECTGLGAAVQDLMNRTAHAVALFGVLREDVRFGWSHWSGLTVLGYGRHNRAAGERALGHLLAGQLQLAPLVTRSLPLSRYAEGVDLLRDKQALKVCFLPWEE